MNSKKQSEIFLSGEGDAWFKRNQVKKEVDFIKNIQDDPLIPLLEKINLPKGCDIITAEIGMGQGLRLEYLKEKYDWQVLGIDPSREAINSASNLIDQVFVGTAESLPFDDSSLDLLIFGFCLYLCDRSDLFKIAAEAHRVLKKKSWIAIEDFWSSYPRANKYKHLSGVYSYKADLSAMFSWHPSYVIFDHQLHRHNTKSYTDDCEEWVSSTLLRRFDPWVSSV